MDERRRVEGYVEQVLDVVVDLVLPLQVAADVDFQQRGFGDVHIDVRTDVVAVSLVEPSHDWLSSRSMMPRSL